MELWYRDQTANYLPLYWRLTRGQLCCSSTVAKQAPWPSWILEMFLVVGQGVEQHAEPSFCSTAATEWCALQHSPVSRSRYTLCWRGYQQHGPDRELSCSWASCTSLIGTGAAPWCAVKDAHVANTLSAKCTPSKLGHVCFIVLYVHDFQAA